MDAPHFDSSGKTRPFARCRSPNSSAQTCVCTATVIEMFATVLVNVEHACDGHLQVFSKVPDRSHRAQERDHGKATAPYTHNSSVLVEHVLSDVNAPQAFHMFLRDLRCLAAHSLGSWFVEETSQPPSSPPFCQNPRAQTCGPHTGWPKPHPLAAISKLTMCIVVDGVPISCSSVDVRTLVKVWRDVADATSTTSEPCVSTPAPPGPPPNETPELAGSHIQSAASCVQFARKIKPCNIL